MIRNPFFIPVFILTIAYSATATGQTLGNDDKARITRMSKARAKAFNEKNAEAIAKYFTDDAVLMAPGKQVAIGKEAVRLYYQGIFDEYDVELESRYEEVEVSGDMAYGRGEAIVKATPKDGGKATVTASKYLNILRRSPNGNWMTTHDIWNGNGMDR